MSRFANIPNSVKAVFPMKQNFIKGTAQSHVKGAGKWQQVSKLDAIADGYRTTTTRDNMQDILAMRRLQPGDNIAFYNSDGDVVFSNYQGSDRLPQEIFYPANQGGYDARVQYAAGEGGNTKYPNVTLFGSFQPQVIPLDQPFDYGKGYKPGLSGNSYLMHYNNPSEVINYASYLPDSSSDVGAVNRLPKQIADKIRAREAYTQTYADTGLYKDNQIVWEGSPLASQSGKGRSPYIKDNLNNPIYDTDQLGALGLVDINGDGNLTKVQWENRAANGGVKAVYYDKDGNKQYLDLSDPNYSSLVPHKPVFVPHNLINAAFNNSAKYGTTDVRSAYAIEGTGSYNKDGKELFKLSRRSIPVDAKKNPSSRMQTPDDALNSINALIQQGNVRDGAVKELYYGNTSEPSYDAIQALARRGGSGKWTDYGSSGDYNFWKMGGSSYADHMNQIDLENAGYTIDDFPGGVAFNDKGMPVDIPGYQVPQGYRNLPPASEFYENAPQRRYMEPRQIQRLIEESNLAKLTPLSRYYINDYGVVQNKDIDYAGTTPLSVQLRNGTLNTTQQASLGKWFGGGLEGKGNDRSDSLSNPLIGEYKIRIPQGVAYKPVNINGRYEQVVNNTLEDNFIPYETRYDIDYGIIPDSVDENNYRFGNTIPGKQVEQIEGAYLPGLVETGTNQFEPQMVPYAPHPDYYDQHLADVRIKLGNEYYPLTREATTTQYIPSESQLQQQAGEMYGKRKFFKDGSFEEYDYDAKVPDDIDVTKARNNAVYNNPYIEGASDIVGALDRERNLIKRLSTIAEQKLPYNINQGVGYDAIDPYGSMKMDMMLLQSNPIYAASSRVNITSKYPIQDINTLDNSVLESRVTPEIQYKQKVPSTDLTLTYEVPDYQLVDKTGKLDMLLLQNPAYARNQLFTVTPKLVRTNDDNWEQVLNNTVDPNAGYQQMVSRSDGQLDIGSQLKQPKSSMQRFISDNEVLDIERKMGIRPVRKQLVETDDGNNYYIDADDEIVKASDLAALFDNPNQKLSLEEVMQILDTKINNFTQAENAYTQLMNLEPQDEIIINAELGKKRGNQLGRQLQQAGLESTYNNGNLTARGSIEVTGLPGYEGFKLPVTRFKQDNSDPEITALYNSDPALYFGNAYPIENKLAKIKEEYADTVALEQNDVWNGVVPVNNSKAMHGKGINYDRPFGYQLALPPAFSPNDDPREIALHQLQQEINTNPPDMNDVNYQMNNSSSIYMAPSNQVLSNTGDIATRPDLFPKQKLRFTRSPYKVQDPWYTPEEMSIVNFDTVPDVSMSDAYLHKYLAPPNYSLVNTGDIAGRMRKVRRTGTISRFGDSFPELTNQPRPIGQQEQVQINPDQLVIEQPNISTTESISQSQYPQWLKPGLIGAGVLGVAGLSQYYQQQQRDRDTEEQQLRRMYGY